jgi:uncharacterized SAM-binding protein YcdF (DUF218 family)
MSVLAVANWSDVAMHFALSKAVGFFSVPSNVIASLAVLGLVLMVFRRPSGAMVAVGALAAVVVVTLSPLGNMLLTPLEQRFPEMKFPDQGIDGIIVLGGSYDTRIHGYLNTILLQEDSDPMAVIPGLALRYPKAQIVFSGGTDPSSPGQGEAAFAKQYFVSFGIAADRISIEERSLTTEENARFTAQLIHPWPHSRWLLVTNAFHMPRAMGAFRKAGFNVIPFSVGWRTHGWRDLWWPSAPATENLRRVDVAAHEWIGLLIYRLSGYSDEWFAGPHTDGSDS